MYIAVKSSDTLKSSKGLMSRALLSVASIAVISALPQIALAQTAPDSAETAGQQADEIDEIIVTGFRQSIADALASKRNSGNVSDAIKAEDIGKSTDQNIAEALQRITGIGIIRGDNGEGTSITVRGTDSNLNNITLNGITLTNGGAGNGVDLSQFSADVLSSIEVVKTPSASHDEGSLGASVILKSFSPLDAKQDRRAIEIQGRYASLTDNGDGTGLFDTLDDNRKLSLSFSDKFNDDKVGVSFVLVDEKARARNDKFDVNNYRAVNLSRFNGAGAINQDTGEFITQFDYGNVDADGNAVGLEDIVALIPNNIRYRTQTIDTDRTTLTGTLQYQPNDNTNVQFDATYAQLTTDRATNEFSSVNNFANRNTATAALQGNVVFDPNTFVVTRNVHTARAGAPNNDNREDVLQIADTRDTAKVDTLTLSGLVEKTIGDFDFSLRAGHSSSDLETPERLFTRFRNIRNRRTDVAIGYDCGADLVSCDFVVPGDYLSDPTTFTYNTGNVGESVGSDDSTSLFFDTKWNNEVSIFESFEAGFKWSKRDKDSNTSSVRFNVAETGNVLTPAGFTFSDFAVPGRVPSDFGDGIGINTGAVGDNFVGLDARLVVDELANLGFEPTFRQDLRNTNELSLDVIGGYVQGNFKLAGGDIFGDIGARLVHTKSRASGFSGFIFNNADFTGREESIAFFGSEAAALAALGVNTNVDSPATPSFGENTYTNFLPSLNINWLAREDLVLRAAASKTIARPRIANLSAGFVVNEDIFSAESRATVGNPFLNPFESRNLDLSAEWYFDDNSLFSVALFNKDLSNFESRISFQSFLSDPRSALYDANGDLLPEDQINFVADLDTLFLPFGGGDNQAGCFPNREQDLSNPFGTETCDVVNVTQARNGTDGFIRGVEISAQHNFDYLPGVLSGLGFIANYTYSDSQQNGELNEDGSVFLPDAPFDNTSEHTVNLTGFYEDEKILFRAAYNYRSDFLVQRDTVRGNALWSDSFGTLDISAGYKFTDNFSLNFQGQNLTDSVSRQYITLGDGVLGNTPGEAVDFGGNTSRTQQLFNTGPVYRMSARFTF